MANRHVQGFVALVSLMLFLSIQSQPAFANGYEQFPGPIAWSPDSSMFAVAYPADFNGYTYFGELFVYDKYGRIQLDLGQGFSSPSFSPDGEKLAVVLDGDVLVYELEDTKEAMVMEIGDALDCTWATMPDGTNLLFSQGGRFGSADIYAENANLTNESRLTDTAGDAACVAPVASPDGRFVAFTRQPGAEGLFGYERIWLLDTTTGGVAKAAPEQTREWDYHESNPVWVDNETMLFQRGGWGDWHVYRRNVITGKEFLELTDAQQPSLSGDGRWMGFTRRDYETKQGEEYDWEIEPAVWLMDRESRLIYRVSKPGVVAQHPAVSPDGKRIAWLETSADGEMLVKTKRIQSIAHPLSK